tara:strand:- start:23974 stop:24516 length:543 start_codon:yes stop_codon:yes gene_type:complete
MALTQGAWTSSSVNGTSVHSCVVTATTAENDGYTLKTPKSLDPTKPWVLVANSESVAIDGSSTTVVDIYGGYSDDFAITGDAGTVAATDGTLIGTAVMDDIKAAQVSIIVDPNYTGAVITSTVAGVRGRINLGQFPYYAFNANAGSTLAAADCTWKIIQMTEGSGGSDLDQTEGIGADPS